MGKKTKFLTPAQNIKNRINSALKLDVLGLASDPRFKIERVPIGILTMERITGGGFPRGRHVELYGDENAGKSLVAYMTMVLAQARGEVCVLVDPEKIFDESWFRHLGGDPEELLYFRPRTAEQVIQVLMLLCGEEGEVEGVSAEEMGAASIVTIDSVSALLPLEELTKDPLERDQPGSQARMMSRLLRRVTTMNDNTLFLWTNQLREKIGRIPMPPTTSGGRALRFYATTRIEMKKGEKASTKRKRANTSSNLVESTERYGHWVQIRSEKEKSARPYMQSMFFFNTDEGRVDEALEIIHLGLEDGLITRSGNTFRYVDSDDNEWSGQREKFKKFVREEDDLREELRWAISENTRVLSMTEEVD